MPNWKPESRPVRPLTEPSHQTAGATEAEEPSLGRQLLTSAAWVIGIPAVITLLIIIAIWFTENIWMPTQHVLGTALI